MLGIAKTEHRNEYPVGASDCADACSAAVFTHIFCWDGLTSVKHVFFFNLDAKQLHMKRNILRAVMRFTNGYIHIGVFI